jgi:geranylgeranyl reductase
MYDIAIIGAGPAGATLARLTGKKYKILLIDKRDVTASAGDTMEPKCCGGLLAPDAQKMLAKMGLGLPLDILAEPQLFAVRAIDIPAGIERYYQRSYLNINRGRFDQWLVSLIPSGVDILPRCFFRSLEQDREGITLHLVQDERTFSERAKIVVAADGAFSLVRKAAFPRDRAPRAYVAIQEWFAANKALPYFTAVFDPEITDFYSWIIPKNGSVIVGSALAPGEAATLTFERVKEKLCGYGFEFGRSIEKKGGLLLRPVSASMIDTGKNNIALIGEAAGWISPSSSEGISYAFRSAIALAEALETGLGAFPGRYREKTRVLRLNIVLKNLKSPFLYDPLLRKLIMKSGIKSMGVGHLEDHQELQRP